MVFSRDASQFVLLAVACISVIRGQNYAQRSGSLHADAEMFAVTDGEEEYETDYYYDWSHVDAGVRRWNVEEYPHPVSEPWACQRKTPSYVCDPDKVLSPQQGDELDISISRIFNETACICKVCKSQSGGVQLGIALLKHTYQPYNEHPSKIIQSFSRNLRSKWNLGECENDLLIVVVTEDRQSFTDVGSTTKNHISLREAYKVFLENKALFTAGQYFEGLLAMLKNYHQITRDIAADREKDSKSRLTNGEITGIVFAILLAIFILVIGAVFLYKRYKKYEDSKKQRKKADNLPKSFQPIITKEYQKCNTEDADDIPRHVKRSEVTEDLPPPLQTSASDERKEETIFLYTPPSLKDLQPDTSANRGGNDDTFSKSADVNGYDELNITSVDNNTESKLSRSRLLLQTDM